LLLKIGSINIDPGLALAPMAGVADHPFRVLVKEQGCPLVYSEMISAKGLVYSNRRNRALLHFTERERPIGFQLFGSDPEILAEGARIIESYEPDFIDLNFGCPTPKIVRNGDGGALMRNPALCGEIFRKVSTAVSCPVTVKIRTGWDENSINAPEIALLAEENGVKVVTVHGRTVKQGYQGEADWRMVKIVKENLTIPVIGNGDIDSPQKAEEMINYSRCDGIMVGRAARGNPWIFRAILAWLQERKELEAPGAEDIYEMVLRHFKLLSDFKGEKIAAREMRRHAAWYVRGLKGASAARQQLVRVKTDEELKAIMKELLRLNSR